MSAIGRVGATYSQNAKTLEEYCDLLDQGRLPVVRGLALSRDDLARRAVIMALMCQGQIAVRVDRSWPGCWTSASTSRAEIEQLRELEEHGPGARGRDRHPGHGTGWFFVRAIAMVFDRYLQADRNRARFSRII